MDTEPSKTDSSDQKASNLLIETLKKLQKETPKKKQDVKVTPPRSYSKRKRSLKFEENQPKIADWLHKKKLEPLDITVNAVKPEEKPSKKAKSKSKTLKRNSSFEKYGIVMPSLEKIVADQKKFNEHKDGVKQLDVFDEDILSTDLANDCLDGDKEFNGELLDCKHLSLEQLTDAFKTHLKDLTAIMKGKKYSDRHKKFYKGNFESQKDLRCSSSLVVFSHEQKEHLLDLMKVEMDHEDKLNNYFFKVLLPELCLMIFMDEHKMSKRKANNYLDKRPLDV